LKPEASLSESLKASPNIEATMVGASKEGRLLQLRDIHPKRAFFGGPLIVFNNIRENKDMLSNFIQKDIRVRYRNSFLGYLWTVLQPLLLSGVYYFLFTILAGNPEELYPLWVLIGVITWGLFSKSLNGSITSLSRNAGMIKQIYFPREIFSLSVVGSNVVITSLSLAVVIPFMVYYELNPGWQIIYIPISFLLIVMMAWGVGMMLAPLNAIHGDIAHLFQFVTRAGFFLSPVMWTISMVPSSKADILDYILLNPMVVPLEMMRSGIDGRPLAIGINSVYYSASFACISLFIGMMVFIRYERNGVKYL
jgi:ABC-type polysaccharide/polyol phosphate export permease